MLKYGLTYFDVNFRIIENCQLNYDKEVIRDSSTLTLDTQISTEVKTEHEINRENIEN